MQYSSGNSGEGPFSSELDHPKGLSSTDQTFTTFISIMHCFIDPIG